MKNTNIQAHLSPDTTGFSSRTLGVKYFELADYLGNVKEVISDRKLAIFDGGGDFEYFYADIVSYGDFYPFGSEIKSRTYNSGTYRMSFQGKESDPEIKGEGNSYNFEARIYDPRVGRWFTRDSKWEVFPAYTPYSFAGNNPIYYVDTDGNIIEPANEKAKEEYNNSILKTFDGNDLVIDLLKIKDENNSTTTISYEDYNKAMMSLNTVDERVAFRGLYLSINSDITYELHVITGEEEVNLDGVNYNSNDLIRGYGTSEPKEIGNKRVVTVAVGLTHYGIPREGTVMGGNANNKNTTSRKREAMVLGAIVATEISIEENHNKYSRPYEEKQRGVTYVQTENIFTRAKYNRSLGTELWKDSNNNFFDNDAQKRMDDIPDQIRYEDVHTTYEVSEKDVIIRGRTSESPQNSKTQNNQDDK